MRPGAGPMICKGGRSGGGIGNLGGWVLVLGMLGAIVGGILGSGLFGAIFGALLLGGGIVNAVRNLHPEDRRKLMAALAFIDAGPTDDPAGREQLVHAIRGKTEDAGW